MLSLVLREMRAHARRLVATSLAVVLGVAFLTGTLVLGSTLRDNFDELSPRSTSGPTWSCAPPPTSTSTRRAA